MPEIKKHHRAAHRADRNQEKIDSLKLALDDRINKWLEERPTGRLVLTAEIDASQGGITDDIALEKKEWGRV